MTPPTPATNPRACNQPAQPARIEKPARAAHAARAAHRAARRLPAIASTALVWFVRLKVRELFFRFFDPFPTLYVFNYQNTIIF
jgi:hypothetical protein